MIIRFFRFFMRSIHFFYLSVFILTNGSPTMVTAACGKEVFSRQSVQRQVTGVARAATGVLPGVTITVKGSPSQSTATDAKGRFTISGAIGQTLVISAIGYKRVELVVDGKPVTVILEEETDELEEVVVVGFGTQKKVNLTGCVQAIGAKDLADRPVTNVSTALQGKFAGVTIIQNSGQPGKDGGSIRIRGLGAVNNPNPLVIVDGIESSMNNINYRKYIQNPSSYADVWDVGTNIIVQRYAEILLLNAEANIELNVLNDQMYDRIDLVRERAGMKKVDRVKYASKEKLRELVRRELRVELAGEGRRRFDIIRWGIAKDVLNGDVFGYLSKGSVNAATGEVTFTSLTDRFFVEKRNFAEGKNELWPIPQAVIDRSKSTLEQNPNY